MAFCLRRTSVVLIVAVMMLAGLTTTAWATDTFEPNNDAAHATAATNPGTYVSYISTENDIDVYKLHLVPGNLMFSVTAPDPNMDMGLNLYGTDYATETYPHAVASADDNGDGRGEELSYSITSEGDYYIVVDETDYEGAYNINASYSLTISTPNDTNEPNNAAASAIRVVAPGVHVSYISTENDIDVYKLHLVPGNLMFSVTAPDPNMDMGLNLYGTDYATETYPHAVASADDNGDGRGEELSYSITSEGDYYIVVDETDYEGAYNMAQSYSLTIDGSNLTKFPATPRIDVPASVNLGGAATIWLGLYSGTTAVPGMQLQLQASPDGATGWTTVQTLTSATHMLSASVSPVASTWYRVIYAGDAIYQSGASAPERLVVRTTPPVYSTRLSLSAPSSVRARTKWSVRGSVSPASAVGRVHIALQRLVGRSWRGAGSANVVIANGRLAYTFKPSIKGSWRLTASYGGQTTSSAVYKASSATRSFKVK